MTSALHDLFRNLRLEKFTDPLHELDPASLVSPGVSMDRSLHCPCLPPSISDSMVSGVEFVPRTKAGVGVYLQAGSADAALVARDVRVRVGNKKLLSKTMHLRSHHVSV